MFNFQPTILKVVLKLICLLFFTNIAAQDKAILGFEFMPLQPSTLYTNSKLQFDSGGVNFKISPKAGYNFGFLVRKKLYKGISFESGISRVRRQYQISINSSQDTFTANGNFRLISYELPAMATIFIKLNNTWFIDNGFGLSFDFPASRVLTGSPQDTVPKWSHLSVPKFFAIPGLSARFGVEMRTKNSGSFGVGMAYRRLLTPLMGTVIGYTDKDGVPIYMRTNLTGHYFGFYLKYFVKS